MAQYRANGCVLFRRPLAPRGTGLALVGVILWMLDAVISESLSVTDESAYGRSGVKRAIHVGFDCESNRSKTEDVVGLIATRRTKNDRELIGVQKLVRVLYALLT